MRTPPAYFDAIRERAQRRWEQLERDPELAGPWHQLFKQVQSPRHIVSELLQNADDAGATEASVRIENGSFVFEHNGEDFTEEHFSSLCRFGYSNKRALHTIGFRGVGFKSTFSLGDQVELSSPTLSVLFHRSRFTEPKWRASGEGTAGLTRVRVEINDPHRQRQVEKNLDDWLQSPMSLLFFKNIRRMLIGDQEVHWGSLGPGPIPESEWMALYGNEDEAFLLVRSEFESFPDEALAEIQQERMLGTDEAATFPPCRVEIVMGAEGELYVVLPTGVQTDLPFACNAPFIQDPARLKIKDPETSPTNRWLLERTGRLAAAAMLHWLGLGGEPPSERAAAYGLFPDVDREDGSLDGVCGTMVEEVFGVATDDLPILLTDDGQLVPSGESVIIPPRLAEIWPLGQAAAFLDEAGRTPLSMHVSASDRKKLLNWGLIEEVDRRAVFSALQGKHLPKPETWRQLLILWAYVAPEITGWTSTVRPNALRIVPVQAGQVLYSASEVVRLGEGKLLQSDEDWDFLAEHLITLNPNWPRFLAAQRREASEGSRASASKVVEAAYTVLERIGLGAASDVNRVIDQVAAGFFTQEGRDLAECVRLAQVAAKLNAKTGPAFRFATRDRRLRAVDADVLFDSDGRLEAVIPDGERPSRLLHHDYTAQFRSCTRDAWTAWIRSGRAGLKTAPAIKKHQVSLPSAESLLAKLEEMVGYRGSPAFPYSTRRNYTYQHYYFIDFDFDTALTKHWSALPPDAPELRMLLELLLTENPEHWADKVAVAAEQTSTGGGSGVAVPLPTLPAAWLRRFSSLPCLPDTRGFYHKPSELLRRTPETESLMDVELFVHGRLDHEAARPLLDLLGVRSSPTGPDGLLDRLRALGGVEDPPVHEVEKWYRRIDQLLGTSTTEDANAIVRAFEAERLILAEDGTWVSAAGAFLFANEDDVPDAAVVRSSVRDLALWRRVGVAERPTPELAIAWLNRLAERVPLSSDDLRRVRALISRHPYQVWRECGKWLSLAGEWTPIEDLRYSLSMQSLVPWSHLHRRVKQRTADLQRLPTEATLAEPFSSLPPLAAHLDERFQSSPNGRERPGLGDWLRVVGTELCRIQLNVEEDTQRVRRASTSLARTTWVETPEIEIIPYLDGTPAGTARRADVLWMADALYVLPMPTAKLARRVPEEIGKVFGRPDIKAALDYSYGRQPQEICEYLQENFTLGDPRDVLEEQLDPDGQDFDDPGTSTPSDAAGQHEANSTTDSAAPPSSDDGRAPPAEVGADGSDGAQGDTEDHQPSKSPRAPHRPSRPPIIERLARSQGFQKDGADRFFHGDGSWIARVHDERSLWERRTSAGDFVTFYWPKDHCLERDPLELEAEVWALIEEHPHLYSLVLADSEGDPVEVAGSRLLAMREQGQVTLYPASYRLVFEEKRRG